MAMPTKPQGGRSIWDSLFNLASIDKVFDVTLLRGNRPTLVQSGEWALFPTQKAARKLATYPAARLHFCQAPVN